MNHDVIKLIKYAEVLNCRIEKQKNSYIIKHSKLEDKLLLDLNEINPVDKFLSWITPVIENEEKVLQKDSIRYIISKIIVRNSLNQQLSIY